MAPISMKKGLIDLLAGELVTQVLEINKQDENYKIAVDYVMSNFRFHRFLDVNPMDVSKLITGLCSKFRVNSQDKKAVHLEELVEKFVNLSLLETNIDEKEIQTDAHYSLLLVLLNLSNNPLNSEFIPKEEKPEKVASEKFDWTAYLLEGEEELTVGAAINREIENELDDSDSELWEFSDEDDEDDDEKDDEHIYAEITGLQKKMQHEKSKHEIANQEALLWLQENVVPSYWIERDITHLTIDDYRYTHDNSDMLKNWEVHRRIEAQQNRHDPIKHQLLIERQLVKETLWMLQGIEDLFVYNLVDGIFHVNESIAVNHLTKETLSSYLSTFTAIGNKVVALNKYAREAASGVNSMSKTFRAFGFVLGRFLMERNSILSALEKNLIDKDKPITLAVLHDKLLNDSLKVNCVHQLYVDAVVTGHDLYSTDTERAVFFLDVFYKCLCTFDSMGNVGLEKVSIVLPMLLDVCEPYLHDLEQWMIMGQLPKENDEEFMIYKAQIIEKGEASYWENTFKIKETKTVNGKRKPLVPLLIQGVKKQVLLAGKSLGLLAEFGRGKDTSQDVDVKNQFATSILSSKPLHAEFVDTLKENLEESNERFHKGEDLPIGEYAVDGGPAIIEDPLFDPLLRENFKRLFLESYGRIRKDKVTQHRNRQEHEDWLNLLKDGSCRPPIELLIEKSLFPAITKRYDKACAVLLELFKKELDLFKHIEIMKDFFLMDAGGTMHRFYSEIFEKAKRKEFWQDMPYLNIVMQDALLMHYPQLMGSLTVSLQNQEYKSMVNLFDGVQLHYKAPWPMSIILDVETEQKYNEIFQFLLKVKRAIWVLEQLRFHELVADTSINKPNEMTSSDGSEDEDEPIRRAKKINETILPPSPQKLKSRILILRMKMMHVIRTLHFYLMTRIQKTTYVEFQNKLKDAKDLDEIMELHQTFLNNLKQRCFLHEKVNNCDGPQEKDAFQDVAVKFQIGRSREAILRILSLVFDFEVLWLANVYKMETNKLNSVEKDFNRCTSFLHSFFSSLAKRGSYPHFDFLAQSLKTETQGHQALFRRS